MSLVIRVNFVGRNRPTIADDGVAMEFWGGQRSLMKEGEKKRGKNIGPNSDAVMMWRSLSSYLEAGEESTMAMLSTVFG